MSLSIVTSAASLQSQSNVNQTPSPPNTSSQQLSTGLTVGSGGEGLAASAASKARAAQIAGLQTALANTNNASAAVQSLDDALGNIMYNLNKIRVLADDSTYLGSGSVDQLAANNAQMQDARNSLNDIASSTQVSGVAALNGSVPQLFFQIGTDGTQKTALNLQRADIAAQSTPGLAKLGQALDAFDKSQTQANARAVVYATGAAMGDIFSFKDDLASFQTDTLAPNAASLQAKLDAANTLSVVDTTNTLSIAATPAQGMLKLLQ